jgi:DNA mismatch repair protein MutL
VRESIGKNNLSPSLDFETQGVIGIPVLRKDTEFKTPHIDINHDFNPFEEEIRKDSFSGYQESSRGNNWDIMYRQRDAETRTTDEEKDREDFTEYLRFMQFKGKYILSPVKSGLMVIDQKRAHERIIYEQNLLSLRNNKAVAQQTLFPETIELNPSDFVTFTEIIEDINKLGFDIREFGSNTIIIHGIPGYVKSSDLTSTIEQMLEDYKSYDGDPETGINEKIARSLAKASAIPYGKVLETEEMRELVDQLFSCTNPNYSPSGKPVLYIIKTDELDQNFK